MKNLIQILALILILFSSCKKDDLIFIIKGQAFDVSLNGALQGATVKLYSFDLGSSYANYQGSVKTDANGLFEFELKREKYDKIRLTVDKNMYFSQSEDISFSELSTENENYFNYKLTAKSWTKIIIKNEAPAETADHFRLYKASGKADCEECCPTGYSHYPGIVDTSFVCLNEANGYMKFFYWVNETEDTGVDSVYNTPFDTITYQFLY